MYGGMALQVLILALLMIAVPVIVGNLTGGADRSLPFRWVSGQMLLWAGFQLICLPMVIAEREFQDVVTAFSGYMAVMVLLAAAAAIRRRAKSSFSASDTEKKDKKKDPATIGLWLCAAALLALQLVLAVCLAYEEGDDAFYVAITTSAESSGVMYRQLPYIGGESELDARHALAPFPIWVAFLSRVTGMRAVTMAQVALPVILIAMSYAVYYLLGKRLFREDDRKLPLFLILIEVMILFGGYSLQSAENFLLVRTAQGKAVLADIVIPFMFLLFLLLLEELQEQKKTDVRLWVVMAAAVAAGCLCSTEGTILTCVLLGTVGSCMLVCYRRWRLLLPLAVCGLMPMCVAFLYVRLK